MTTNSSLDLRLKEPSENFHQILENSEAIKSKYIDINSGEAEKKFITCGSNKKSAGCGQLIEVESFLDNYNICPECGYSYVLGAGGWIDCLTDKGTFSELYRDLSVEHILNTDQITDYYRAFLDKQEGNSFFKESLATGVAKINNHEVVLAISEFYYCGGSMGVVFGEKFSRAADFAVKENLPFITLCCSGGARLYEGTLALMQMLKTIEAVNRLKNSGLPYISILANPSTGGAIASYAALGDITIAEPDALVSFTGPRVMKSRGFKVEDKLIKSHYLHEISANTYNNVEYYHNIRGIQEICERKNMAACLVKYMELYQRFVNPS